MSRPILSVTLRLEDGKVLSGRGRNLPATIEKIFNDGLNLTPRRHVKILKNIKSGYVMKGENRYEGTFHARMTDQANSDSLVVVDVKPER